MHFDDKKGGNKGGQSGQSGQSNICECKHADWFSYGYCSVGTTSSDVKGCQQAYLTCCGWGMVGASSRSSIKLTQACQTHPACVRSCQLKCYHERLFSALLQTGSSW